MTTIDTSTLQFTTPPECQGQAVEYSYAAHQADIRPDCIVERRRESGEPDQFFLYVDPEWADGDGSNLEFHNAAPELGECVLQWSTSAN